MSARGAAQRAVSACRRLGVAEFCVCPGSRNGPILAVLAASGVKCYRFFEERSAGFFALGRAMATRRPVAVVVTSGTAVAELLPAVIEAHYQGLPLVVVSADRPEVFRGSGAPQAIEQVGIFGEYVEGCVEIGKGDLPEWSGRRPIHLNVAIGEPAAVDFESTGGGSEGGENLVEYALPVLKEDAAEVRNFLADPAGLLVLAGGMTASDAAAAAAFLERLGAPIWAEATSGLWGRAELEGLMLRGPERTVGARAWKKVLRLGAVPSLRFWRDLEERREVEVCSVSGAGFSGLGRGSRIVVRAEPGSFLESVGDPPASWTGEGSVFAADRAAAERVGELQEEFPRSEVGLIGEIAEMIPEGAAVFLGNSLPIREWNLGARRAGGGKTFYANRGANGIDGALSTFLGCCAESEEGWGVFGDLAALYDLGAPWVLPQLSGRRRFVIVNNGGGGIFGRLPAMAGASEMARRMIETPHEIGFEGWAKMWGMDYVAVEEAGAIDVGSMDDVVIEVRPDGEESAAFWKGLDGIG